MIRTQVAAIVSAAVASLQADGTLPATGLPEVDIAEPRDPSHGDFACNFALVASKAAGKNPREIAERLVAAMDFSGLVTSAEVAGPGFLNLRLKPELAAAFVAHVLKLGTEGLAKSAAPAAQQRINIEFVSVNPNGPITVGSGRGAAFGSTLANVLQAAGHGVHREYYINDGVNSEQMRQFARSLQYYVETDCFTRSDDPEDEWRMKTNLAFIDRFLQTLGPGFGGRNIEFFESRYHKYLGGLQGNDLSEREQFLRDWHTRRLDPSNSASRIGPTLKVRYESCYASGVFQPYEAVFPERGYRGDYVNEVAEDIRTIGTDIVDKYWHRADFSLEDLLNTDGEAWFQKIGQEFMLRRQRIDLANFGVEFDTWFSEQSLHDRGMVERDIADLIAKGAADTRTTRFKLKLGKGGVLEGVDPEPQSGDVDDDGLTTNDAATTNEERRTTNAEDPTHDPTTHDPTTHDPTTDDPRPTTHHPLPTTPISPTLWLRSTKFGDDMDRVLRRQDGRLTYIASDVSYHKDKFNRGSKPRPDGACEQADKLITVLGPDHHGYIGRLHAVLGALLEENAPGAEGEPLSELEAKLYATPAERNACRAALAEAREKLEVVIFQIVRFVKEGKPAPMRKRDGNIYSLRDLMAEIGKTMAPDAPEDEQMTLGKDVARFFYLMRSHDTHMDFDIDLATKQSDENPVFYCQYAHARICSVLRKAEEAGFGADAAASAEDLSRLTHEREIALIKKVCDLSFEVQRCAEDYGVHRLTTYAQDLAKTYHYFYDVCRVIQPEDAALTRARLALCHATAVGLRSVFGLLGISAPERMDRAAQIS